MRHDTLGLRATFVVLALLLAACNAAEVTIDLREGGSGSAEMWLATQNTPDCTFQLETFSDVLDLGREDGTLDPRIDYAPHSQSGLAGFLFHTEFTSADEIEQRIANVRNLIRSGDDVDLDPDVFDFRLEEQDSAAKKTSTVRVLINPNQLFIGPMPDSECRLEVTEFRLAMPEAVVSYDSVPPGIDTTVPSTRTVVWSLPIEDRTVELSAVSERTKSLPTVEVTSRDPLVVTDPPGSTPWGAIGVFVAVAALVVAIAGTFFLRRD